MCFYLVFLFALILSVVIVSTITKYNTVETFERCLCSPLGEPQCSVYTGPSQYNRGYSYNNYGGPSTADAVVSMNMMQPAPLLFGGVSQADRGYGNFDSDVNFTGANAVMGMNVQSAPLLIGGVSQADKGYATVRNDSGYAASQMSYGILESDKLLGLNKC